MPWAEQGESRKATEVVGSGDEPRLFLRLAVWLQAVSSSKERRQSLHPRPARGVFSRCPLDESIQKHPQTELRTVSTVEVPKRICAPPGNSFFGHPQPSSPADPLGELSSLLNLPPPHHSP